MPIKRDLNVAPYYDDFDIEKKYYRVLFKPGYAVQARELTQLQTILQNQIEQFGDNIFKEGSVIKGCTFTELKSLAYVKLTDAEIDGTPFTPTDYTDYSILDENGLQVEYYFEVEGSSGLKAYIVTATNGFQSKAPDLNTFYINYLNSVPSGATDIKVFSPGETLNVRRYKITKTSTTDPLTQVETITENPPVDDGIVATVSTASFSDPVGISYGLAVTEGIIFQRGHFLYSDAQTIVLTKYLPKTYAAGEYVQPNEISVGFVVTEEIINSQQDVSLLDNANGSENENAPGADRLKLSPVLVALPTSEANIDTSFFTLRRYENGAATLIRDVSQFNSISTEMARRTFEESGDYVAKPFRFATVRKNNAVNVQVGPGIVYSKGYRVQNNADVFLPIEDVSSTSFGTQNNQPLSFQYGGYFECIDESSATGLVDLVGFSKVNLLDSGESVVGSAIVKDYTIPITRLESTLLNTSTKGRLYLFAIRMVNDTTAVSDVMYVQTPGATGKIKVSPLLKDSKNSKLVFDLGQSFVKGVNDFVLFVRKKSASQNVVSSVVTITPAAGETYTTDCLNKIVVVSQNNLRLPITSASINGQGRIVLTIVGQSSGSVTVYHNARISPTSVRAKQSVDCFVKVTFLSTPTLKNKYTLGLPDGYKLLEVTGTTNSVTTDYTSSFRLVSNQKDDFYDHSYIELISGKTAPPNGTVLTVKFSVFRPDASGVYNLFTVNSYSTIDPTLIPTFSGKSGVYDLRDCIDLRPHRVPLTGVNYATTSGGAPSISSAEEVELPAYSVELFSTGQSYVYPAQEAPSTVDVDYYYNRTDAVVANSLGFIYLVKGEEAAISKVPEVSGKTIIATVYVPGYPTYTAQEAKIRNRMSYGVLVKKYGIKNYTMKDIDDINKKIEDLTYYVTLSQLESETQNLLVKDADGYTRFKNGIIVDPFNDLNIADVTNQDFNASLDFTERSIAPSVQTFPMNLKLISATGAQSFKNMLSTLSPNSSSIKLLGQETATNYRTCTSNFYLYNGEGFLSPEYDGAYDTVANPMQVTIDIAGVIDETLDAIQEFIPLQSSSSKVIARSSQTTQSGNQRITDTSQTIQTITNSLQTSPSTIEQSVGDFVTSVSFEPFMRSREVKIFVTGLRPDTLHYFFFDGIDVNAHVAPAKENETATTNDNPFDTIARSGAYGSPVRSNSAGQLFASFFIPQETFYVGDRKLEIVDVDDYESIQSASQSKCTLTYHAYNFNTTTSSLTVSTRIPEFSIDTSTTTDTVTNRTVVTIPDRNDNDFGRPRNGRIDPLAQTFFIKENFASPNDCVYVSKIDLYFKRKSSVNGVTVMLREVENGYPAYEILPFSKIHLKKTQVNVSEDGSAVTTVNFKAPVRLDVEKEYCVVIMPDAADPDYLIFTAKVGGTNLITNEPINQDWGDGVLFTSTNNRAWQSYQDEDIKFTLYRYNFNSPTGNLTLGTNGPEFFTLSQYAGKFIQNELVYALKGTTTFNASFTEGSQTVTGSSIGLTYSVGDYIYVPYADGTKDLLKVKSVAGNNNSLITTEAARSTGTFTTRTAVAGKVINYAPYRPSKLSVEESSARSGRIFAANNSLIGLASGATGIIATVDNFEMSYVQPSIPRTTDKKSSISLSYIAVDPENPSDLPYEKSTVFNDKTVFDQKGAIVYSKSNDLNGQKGFKLKVSMSNDSVQTSTASVDVENATMLVNRYNINDSISAPISAYVSKVVTLADGFDAEDFKLYVTAYRPLDTNIDAYIRIENAADPLSIENNPWIPFDITSGRGVYCSNTNRNDFREYEFDITNTDDVDGFYGKTAGVVWYKNASGMYDKYKNFQIKIVMRSNDAARVPRLLDYRGIAVS